MRSQFFVVSSVAVLLAVSSAPATAQVNFDQVYRTADELNLPVLAPFKQTGHDKCKGNGHGKGKGGGHEGEDCGEEEAPPETAGPVSEGVCNLSMDAVESSWQRYSCTVSVYTEAYATDVAADAQAYVADVGDHTVAVGQETGDALLSALTNGANGLTVIPRPGNPPQPVIPTDVAATPTVVQQFAVATQNYVQNYAIDAGNHAVSVGQTGAGAILSALGNGGNGLVVVPRPGNPPSPVIPTELPGGAQLTVYERTAAYANTTSAYALNYGVDVSGHADTVAQETGDALLSALTNGANGLVVVPRPGNPPQPVIPTDVTATPTVVQQFAVATQNYVQNYAIDAGNHAAQVGQTGAGAILSALGNGGNGLVVVPRPGNPPSPVMPGVNTTVQEGAAIVVSITSGGG